jgi:hypothetical protein
MRSVRIVHPHPLSRVADGGVGGREKEENTLQVKEAMPAKRVREGREDGS